MPERAQNKHLKSFTKLPPELRFTKGIRFTLPLHLAQYLEDMPKEKRDELIRHALEAALQRD